jgi:hypothetical protein
VRLVRDVSSSAASWPRDSLRLPDATSMVRPPKKTIGSQTIQPRTIGPLQD